MTKILTHVYYFSEASVNKDSILKLDGKLEVVGIKMERRRTKCMSENLGVESSVL